MTSLEAIDMDIDRSLTEFYGVDDGQFHSISINESPTETTLYIDGEMVAIEERAPLPFTITIFGDLTQDAWDRLRDV